MTVSEMKDRMDMLEKQGFGEYAVESWDPDIEEWHEVTCLTYGVGSPVRIYTDED